MEFAPVLTLTLSHGFYGDAPPPLALRPTDPQAFRRAGLILRQAGATAAVLAETGDDRPDAVDLALAPNDPAVLAVTRGADWSAVPVLEIGPGIDSVAFADTPAAETLPRGPRGDLARLRIALPGGGARALTLRFDAVEALWAYVVTGAEVADGLSVVDQAGAVAFEELPPRVLPDGTAARVLRSTRAIPARARPAQRFTLQRPGPFGPETVIPVLPAAGTSFRHAEEPGDAARLQSDIFVTVW
ncbi:MAG: hypothetical protein ACP5EN_09650 [Rhodovulum sp.]